MVPTRQGSMSKITQMLVGKVRHVLDSSQLHFDLVRLARDDDGQAADGAREEERAVRGDGGVAREGQELVRVGPKAGLSLVRLAKAPERTWWFGCRCEL